MTLPYRKKLIEVALPLKAINEASAREKSIRHGHPSTLHLWWARRPLAACRAVLFASLVDDPDSDPAYQKPDGAVDEDRAAIKRAALFNLIEELVQWENSNNLGIIHSARAEIARCVASRLIETGKLKPDTVIAEGVKAKDLVSKGHCRPTSLGIDEKAGRIRFSFDTNNLPQFEVINHFLAEYAPPVLDPFAGGGSIPLEAQRLGMRVYASDLNPVPVLINKALIEIPPRFAGHPPVNPQWEAKSDAQKAMIQWHGAQGLAEDVRYYGQWMRDEAEKRIGHLYPKVKITVELAKNRPDLKEHIGEELTVIAWLWARTVQCPNPACGARTPLVRSFWVSTKKDRASFADPQLDQTKRTVRFRIRTDGQPPTHTTDRNGARCLFCDRFIKKGELRDISVAHGLEEIPFAVVAEGTRSRVYLDGDVLTTTVTKRPEVTFLEQPMTNDRRWFSPPLYGMPNFSDLFTPRQLVALTTFSDLVQESRVRVLTDAKQSEMSGDNRPVTNGGNGPQAYADAVSTYLGLSIGRNADFWCSLSTWANQPKNELVAHTFTKQALPMVWDYAEANPFSSSGGNAEQNLSFVIKALLGTPKSAAMANVDQLDAAAKMDHVKEAIISTDPPYYDNIGYADLSDFFYVWLRRSLKRVYPSLFATALTPKAQELIASPYRHEGSKHRAQEFFETGLGQTFGRMHDVHHSDFPLTVYYAFKQSETEEDDDESPEAPQTASTGWETMLAGLIRSGFAITGTWPMRTERAARSVGIGTNALASSIILVCRSRASDATIATRKQFMSALRDELPEALRNLQHCNIAPVDLAQAAIGPGMGVFSRYAKVIESDGRPMGVRTALGLINQGLDEVLAEQEGDFDPDTRWALAWFEQFGIKEEAFGVAETLSKAKNTAINGLVEAGVVKAKGGKVQLVSRSELPDNWNPTTDRRLTIWETTQHLIRTLETKGEAEAADLLNKLGGIGETARELAYRLYSICERKKWADEALAYNSLVIAWPELTKLALASRNRQTSKQQNLFE